MKFIIPHYLVFAPLTIKNKDSLTGVIDYEDRISDTGSGDPAKARGVYLLCRSKRLAVVVRDRDWRI